MRVELEHGYVLHTRPYRDTSLLVEFFSRQYGRLSLVAKGAKGRKTRGGNRAALLQLFQPLACGWSGRGELKTLTTCEAVTTMPALPGRSLFSGLYVNELLTRLLQHEDPYETLFDRYEEVLGQLRAGTAEELALRQFELALLEELGYGFALDIDGRSGDPIDDESRYHYHQDFGLVLVTESVDDQRASYLGSDIRKIGEGVMDGSSRHCAKQLMRQVLATHLGDKPLRSRDLFRRP